MSWSAWQDGWDAPFPVPGTNWFFQHRERDIDMGSSLPADTAAAAVDAQTTIDASGYGISTTNFMSLSAGATGGGNNGLSLHLGYQAVTLLGSAHADELPTAAPPALAGLTPGVDYGPIPVEDYDAYTTPYAQYESGSTIFAGWADWPITVESSCFWGFTSGNTDTYPSPSALPVNFWYRDPLSVTPNAVAQPGDWLTYQELGTSLLDHDLLLNLVFVNSYNTDYNDVTIPLSAMDLADASVIMQARYQHGVVIPTVDLTSGGVSQFGFNGLFADPDLGSFSLKPPFATTTTFAPAPQVKFTTPRWRYWIPEGNLSVKTDAGWESVFGPDPFAIREAEGTWFSRGGGLNPLRVRGFGAWIDTINVG